MTTRRMPSALLIAGVILAGCSSAEKTPVAATPNVVSIKAADYTFEAPDTIPSGMTKFVLTNAGPGFHHVQFVRLDSSKTLADLEAALKVQGPPPAWAVFMPGPNAPDPTMTATLTADMAPGNYALICLVDIPDAMPHFARGMVRAMTVASASGVTAAAPTADVTMSLFDYNFTLSAPLTAGHHVIEIANNGPQPHEVEIMRLEPGKTLDDMAKWMAKPEGPPPAHGVGGASVALPGGKSWMDVDLTAGDYVLICFVPDAKDGKPHMEHGMVQPFKVE